MTYFCNRFLSFVMAAFTCLWPLAVVGEEPARPQPPVAASKLPSPAEWPVGQVLFQASETEKRIHEALKKPAAFDLVDSPLGDVAQMMRLKYSIPIALDTEALAADGKGHETPITLSVRDASLESALLQMLSPQGLGFLVRHDRLLLSTKASLSSPEYLSTRVYQVHDLIVMPNDPTAAHPDFDSLIQLLTSTIRPQDWHDNGGTIGWVWQIRAPGVIAVAVQHDEQGHREVENLLSLLRKARVPQVLEAQSRQPPAQPKGMGTAAGTNEGGGSPTTSSTDPTSSGRVQQQGGGFF